MKKKIITLAMVALLAVATVSAGFQLGVNWNTGFPYEKLMDGQEITVEEFFEPNGMNYGPDVRLDLKFLDIGNSFLMSYKDYAVLGGLWYTNEIYTDLYLPLGFLKIGAGVGMQTVVTAGEGSELTSFDTFLQNSNLNYRGTIGFKIGSIELDLQYFVPCNARIQSAIDNSELVADLFTPAFEASRVGLAMLYTF